MRTLLFQNPVGRDPWIFRLNSTAQVCGVRETLEREGRTGPTVGGAGGVRAPGCNRVLEGLDPPLISVQVCGHQVSRCIARATSRREGGLREGQGLQGGGDQPPGSGGQCCGSDPLNPALVATVSQALCCVTLATAKRDGHAPPWRGGGGSGSAPEFCCTGVWPPHVAWRQGGWGKEGTGRALHARITTCRTEEFYDLGATECVRACVWLGRVHTGGEKRGVLNQAMDAVFIDLRFREIGPVQAIHFPSLAVGLL